MNEAEKQSRRDAQTRYRQKLRADGLKHHTIIAPVEIGAELALMAEALCADRSLSLPVTLLDHRRRHVRIATVLGRKGKT